MVTDGYNVPQVNIYDFSFLVQTPSQRGGSESGFNNLMLGKIATVSRMLYTIQEVDGDARTTEAELTTMIYNLESSR
jgi:hypothetical protein